MPEDMDVTTVIAPQMGIEYDLGRIEPIAVQIVMMSDNSSTIDKIIVGGRPKRVHGSSMGDHTTAFVVQIEGINLKIHNKTVPEAWKQISELNEHLKALPGFPYIPDAPKAESLGARYKATIVRLFERISSAESEDLKDKIDSQISLLQEAIAEYLDAREMTPFSTINVGLINKAISGKGKGESAHIKILKAKEKNITKTPEITPENIGYAVVNLFDARAATLFAIETQDNQERMASGITVISPRDPLDILKKYGNSTSQR